MQDTHVVWLSLTVGTTVVVVTVVAWFLSWRWKKHESVDAICRRLGVARLPGETDYGLRCRAARGVLDRQIESACADERRAA